MIKKALYSFSLLLTIFFSQPSVVKSQDISVPDSIVAEMQTKKMLIYDVVYEYKVVYPSDYDRKKKYPALLALSGGKASEAIVNYCYYVWFRSSYFDNFIKILPVAPYENFLMDLTDTEIQNMINWMIQYENILTNNWVIAGTSNGGVTAFKYALAKPDLFRGIITMPGAFNFLEKPEHWSEYKVVLAYGENDPEWKSNTMIVANNLKDAVKSLNIVEMKGQGHILTPDYNINEVYKVFFGY